MGPLADERERRWPFDGFQGDVDIEVRPVQMVRTLLLDVDDLPDRRVPEPGELVEGNEEFAVVDEQPEAMRGDVRDLSDRSALPTRCGFRARASWSLVAPRSCGADSALSASVVEPPRPPEFSVEGESGNLYPLSARDESEARARSTVRQLALALVR